MQPLPPCSAHLLVADPSVWATSLLGVAIRHIICGFIYLFYLLIMMPAEIPKLPHSPASERISWCLDTSPFLWLPTPTPGPISVPNTFASLFIFYILSYLLSKTMGCLSGCLLSSTSVQKLFCGICSAFKCSFDKFVGDKVAYPSYSSAILGPLP